jgi:hypothetical protein
MGLYQFTRNRILANFPNPGWWQPGGPAARHGYAQTDPNYVAPYYGYRTPVFSVRVAQIFGGYVGLQNEIWGFYGDFEIFTANATTQYIRPLENWSLDQIYEGSRQKPWMACGGSVIDP